ncbi:hypothetical protein ACS0TY_030422 [Phlomoides rotata]
MYVFWKPPPTRKLKINTDGTAGYGLVIRTETGRVILAGAKCTSAMGNNTLLEALALRYGLRKSVEYPTKTRLQLQKQTLKSWLNPLMVITMPMLIIGDILSLAHQTRCSGFIHANREANKVVRRTILNEITNLL